MVNRYLLKQVSASEPSLRLPYASQLKTLRINEIKFWKKFKNEIAERFN